MPIDSAKLEEFLGKMIGDMGAAASASLVVLGEKLGLYKALAANGPLSSTGLAETTGTTERYVREWLAAQAAAGYVQHDSATGKFSMTPEQTAVFADEDSPAFLAGGFHGIASMSRKSRTHFARVKVSLGASTANVYSAARRSSFARAIWPI